MLMSSRRLSSRIVATITTILLAAGPVVVAQMLGDAPYLVMYGRIRVEGNAQSRVMDYATELIDGIGPRLTGSPNLKKATAWTLDRLKQMGLSNVRTESWGEFGMGWQQRHISLRMIAPATATFIAQAAPWSPATAGPIAADVVALRGFTDESEFDANRGKLRGKIVLFGHAPAPPDAIPIETPLFERFDDRQLAAFAQSEPAPDTMNYEQAFAQAELMEKTGRFFASEGVRAVIVPSANNPKGGASGGTIYADTNYTFGWFVYQKAHAMSVPLVIVAIEHYGRLKRLLDRNVPVKLELNVDAEFTGDREEGVNVFGDIPGVDPQHKDEVVMVGGHLDSWAAGTGATDDGAGVVIAMEAMRILNALQIKPKRTIRVALWTGEEQGVLGSSEFVRRHIATVPLADTPEQTRMPEFLRRRTGPVALKPDHARLSAVYNLDAGGGKIRGVTLSGNAALVPIFQPWIAPLRDLGMTAVAVRRGCGGDCGPFAQVGIPTLSFAQDPLDYETRTHHTNMDTYEHLIPEDLRQAAIVVAIMVYNTAMRDQLLPRLPSTP